MAVHSRAVKSELGVGSNRSGQQPDKTSEGGTEQTAEVSKPQAAAGVGVGQTVRSSIRQMTMATSLGVGQTVRPSIINIAVKHFLVVTQTVGQSGTFPPGGPLSNSVGVGQTVTWGRDALRELTQSLGVGSVATGMIAGIATIGGIRYPIETVYGPQESE